MEYIYLTILILLSIGGFYAGWRYVGPAKSRWATAVAVLSEAVILLYLVFRFYPAWEYRLIPPAIYPLTEVVSFIPFAMLFFGFTIRRAKTKWLPIELSILALVVFGYGLMQVSWIYRAPDIDPAKFRLTKSNVCLQSTSYTCGAASAVTLLRQYGIEATEQEMASLTHTRRGRGVDLVSLTRGIGYRVKDKGFKADIRALDWDMLRELNRPCIVNLEWMPPFIDHVVVVMKVVDDKVTIADPLSGIRSWTKHQFLAKWRGVGIFIKSSK